MSLLQRRYYQHQLVFLYMVGEIPEMIDHIDRDKLNNCWGNLRAVTPKQNLLNRKPTSRSGYKGVTWDRSCNKYKSQLKVGGKSFNLGRYNTPEEAAKAYDNAIYKHGLAEHAYLNFKENYGKR